MQLPLPITEAFVPFVRSLKPLELQELFTVEVEQETPEPGYNLIMFTYKIAGNCIGATSLAVDYNEKELWWILFLPHAQFDGLERRGIGTLACIESLLSLEKLGFFSGYFVRNYDPEGNMFEMLTSLGVDVTKPFEEYLPKVLCAAEKKRFNYN